jgi:hypothetical protein
MKHYPHRHSQRQRSSGHERAVEAELNRPLTQAELDDLEEEIKEAMGEEFDDMPPRQGPRLVWVNPHYENKTAPSR